MHTASCGAAPTSFNGDVYACDHFVEPAYLRGNIRDIHLAELASTPDQVRFGNGKQRALPRYCLECDVRFACHSGCIKDRIVRTPDGRIWVTTRLAWPERSSEGGRRGGVHGDWASSG